jgi:hypothetical protein
VTASSALTRRTRFAGVSEVVVPSQSGLCGHDIALMVLRGVVDSNEIPPMSPRLDPPTSRGEQYTAVGFGEAGSDGDAGVRRTRSGLSVVCSARGCGGRGVVTNTEFVGEDAVCEGDSGGPALDADGRVLGVVSRGESGCGRAIYSAVAAWRDWIASTARHAATVGGYSPPEWATAEYEAGSPEDGEFDAAGASGDGSPAFGESSMSTRSANGGCSLAAGGHSDAGLAALLASAVAFCTFRARRRTRTPEHDQPER